MPEPTAHPYQRQMERVAWVALTAGAGILALKACLYLLTRSVAVLGDALESVINLVAAGMMLYSLRLSARPADKSHPYGHGKVEFLAIGLEGWLILLAGLITGVEAIRRLVAELGPQSLEAGIVGLAGVAVLDGLLALYVCRAGRRFHSGVLEADGKHLAADVISTVAVVLGLIGVHLTGLVWLDPLLALVVAAVILGASWRLLGRSIEGLMDRSDPADDEAIHAVLEDAMTQGRIRGYHKVRHRRQGRFAWVDMHLQLDPQQSVQAAHEVASAIEGEIERALGNANATAHVEPARGP